MKLLRKYRAPLFVIAMVFSAFIWFYQKQRPVETASAIAARVERATLSTANSNAHKGATQNLPAAIPKNEVESFSPIKLGLEMQNVTNFRPFVDKALLHPELGGNYYAYKALFLCRSTIGPNLDQPQQVTPVEPDDISSDKIQDFISEIRDLAPADTKPDVLAGLQAGLAAITDQLAKPEYTLLRQMSMNRLQTACQGLTKDDLNDKRIVGIMREGNRLNDPLMLAWHLTSSSPPTSGHAREQMLKSLFDISDSMGIMMQVFPVLVSRTNENQIRMVWYDGQWHSGVDSAMVEMGWTMVGCQFGGECSDTKGDFELAYICGMQYMCADNRYAFFLKYMAFGDKAFFEKAMAYSVGMANNVRSKNYAAFIPPN